MIEKVSHAWHKHRFLTLAFFALCLLTIFLLGRMVLGAIYWSNHRDLPIKDWMRLGYIGRSHGVKAERLREAIGLESDKREHRKLGQIAKDRGVDLDDLIADLNAAIAKAKQERQR